MSWINRNLSFLILIAFAFATFYCGYIYLNSEQKDPKIGNVLGGLFTGLIIATVQFLLSLDERSKIDRIKALKVKNVLFDRANEDYYRTLIKGAKIKIYVMGVTASRLLSDFANTDSPDYGKKILLEALNRNVDVRILIPNKQNLSNEKDISNYEIAKSKMNSINKIYPRNFNYKYFDHTPAHSIFNVDDESIIGPVIPGLSSKETPGIHVQNSSKYAITYLDYFNKEWENASEG